MKKYIGFLMMFLVLTGCGKMGKDGRVKKVIDYDEWYNDDIDPDAGKPGVMIMSFNVRYGGAAEDTGDKDWNNRRVGCYKMINTLRPVLMGVQECQQSQRTDLKNNCPGYEVIGRSRDNTENGEQMAIFYQPDSVRIDSWKTFWLTDSPTVVSKYPAAGHYRCATLAKVTHLKSGKQFVYINTHLDLQDVRGYEMGIILDFVRSDAGDLKDPNRLPVVLSADWNDTEDSSIFTEMYETEKFKNARKEARSGDAYGTFNGFSNPNSSTKIDHIFYRDFSSCSKFVTVRQKWEGYQFISDHYPVYAILKF